MSSNGRKPQRIASIDGLRGHAGQGTPQSFAGGDDDKMDVEEDSSHSDSDGEESSMDGEDVPPPVVEEAEEVVYGSLLTPTQQQQRDIRPLPPSSRSPRSLPADVLHHPARPSDPSLVPSITTVPRTSLQRAQARRLIVVLERACLESYKISSGSSKNPLKSGPGGPSGRKGGGEAKYALLNCDDHQGILAKTGRDIADARPDITHQVSLCAIATLFAWGVERGHSRFSFLGSRHVWNEG
jgi:rRNA small subunit pseudouridine methyltransferase Nep1